MILNWPLCILNESRTVVRVQLFSLQLAACGLQLGPSRESRLTLADWITVLTAPVIVYSLDVNIKFSVGHMQRS